MYALARAVAKSAVNTRIVRCVTGININSCSRRPDSSNSNSLWSRGLVASQSRSFAASVGATPQVNSTEIEALKKKVAKAEAEVDEAKVRLAKLQSDVDDFKKDVDSFYKMLLNPSLSVNERKVIQSSYDRAVSRYDSAVSERDVAVSERDVAISERDKFQDRVDTLVRLPSSSPVSGKY